MLFSLKQTMKKIYHKSGCWWPLFCAVIIVILLLAYFKIARADATNKYWIGASGGNFTDNANWSTTAGGTNDTTAPGTTDIANFDPNGDVGDTTATIDQNISVAGIVIAADYTKTITQSASRTVSIGSSGYTQAAGTFAASSAAFTTTSSGNFTVSGGAFNMASSQTVTVAGAFLLSGGSFSAQTTLSVAGNVTMSAGTFTPNFGTLTMTGNSSTLDVNTTQTLRILNVNMSNNAALWKIADGDTVTLSGGLTFSRGLLGNGGTGILKVDSASASFFNCATSSTQGAAVKSGGLDLQIIGNGTRSYSMGQGCEYPDVTLSAANVTMSSSASAVGTSLRSLTLTNGTMDLRNAPTTIVNTATLSGGTLYTGDTTKTITHSGQVIMNTGSTYAAGTGTATFSGNFTMNGGTFTAGSAQALTFGSGTTLNLAGGTFNSTTGNLTIASMTIGASATYNQNGNALILGHGSGTLDVNSALTVSNNLTINTADAGAACVATGDTVTVSGTLTFTNGSFCTGTLNAAGNISVASTFDSGSTGTLNIGGAENQTFSGGSTATTGFVPSLVINKTSGTLTFGDGVSNSFLFRGVNFTYTAGTVNTTANNTTMYFDDTVGISAQGMAFDNVDIRSTSGGTSVSLAGALDVDGNLTLTAGTLDVGAFSAAVNVTGNWTAVAGLLNPRSGAVTLDGANQSISGSTTFYRLNKTVTVADTLTLTAGSTQTITNLLTLQGASQNILMLRSSSSGTPWNIDPQGSRSIQFVDVKDSNNIASAIDVTNLTAIDSGNNTNWTGAVMGISFTATTANGSESTTSVTLNLTVSKSVSSPVAVGYRVSGGTAVAGADFTLSSGHVGITSGTTGSFTFSVINDELDEVNETIIITLEAPYNVILGNYVFTYTINDDEGLPTVAFASATSSAAEGITSVGIPIAVSQISGQDVTVTYTLSGGTATLNGVDHDLASGTTTIRAGTLTGSVPFSVINDTADELDETVVLTLTDATNATVSGQTSYTYIIQDDDGPFMFFRVSKKSAQESVTAPTIQLDLGGTSLQTVSANYSLAGTATNALDYTDSVGVVTFSPGSTTAVIPITIIDDELKESEETIIITLTNPLNGRIDGGVFTYTIEDNSDLGSNVIIVAGGSSSSLPAAPAEPLPLAPAATTAPTFTPPAPSPSAAPQAPFTPQFTPIPQFTPVAIDDDRPSISIDDVTLKELLRTTFVFTVRLNKSSDEPVTVDYSAEPDYETGPALKILSGSLLFEPGEKEKNISVEVAGNKIYEENRTFSLNLSNAQGAIIGDAQGKGKIINDDLPPMVSLRTPKSIIDEDTHTATLTVLLRGQTAEDTLIKLGLSGLAKNKEDYTISAEAILIKAGSKRAEVTLSITDDSLDEKTENILIDVIDVESGRLEYGSERLRITILDNDNSPRVKGRRVERR